tara:strand:+ start:1886 stop:2164 length:279 start_codon:yes stop_codon:yes gene_type:complete
MNDIIINYQGKKYIYERLSSDVNGNPRYKIRFADLIGEFDWSENTYNKAVKLLNGVGGERMNTRHHPYSIKVTSYNLEDHTRHFVNRLSELS